MKNSIDNPCFILYNKNMDNKITVEGETLRLPSCSKRPFIVVAKVNQDSLKKRMLTVDPFVIRNASHYADVILEKRSLVCSEFSLEDKEHLLSLGYSSNTQNNINTILAERLKCYSVVPKVYSVYKTSSRLELAKRYSREATKNGMKTKIVKFLSDGSCVML